MRNTYEFKSVIDMPVMDVDETLRSVKVAFSMVGNIDSDGDVMEPGAFNKTWSERGPSGKNLIYHLIDHNTSIKSIVGKPKELGYDGNYAYGVTPIVDTNLGNDMLKMYQDGIISNHSFGFYVPKDRSNEKDGVRYIKEVSQYEYSSVLWGANSETPTLGMMKSLTQEEQKTKLSDRLTILLKGFKNGRYTDETFSLLEIEIKQIQQSIEEFTNAVTIVTPSPNENEILKVLKETNLKLKKLV